MCCKGAVEGGHAFAELNRDTVIYDTNVNNYKRRKFWNGSKR